MNLELRTLLETYCLYRPDIGYVQGMSYLAGNLLLYMDSYNAFVCFANLLNSPFLLAFINLNAAAMQERYAIFDTLFRTHLPQLYQHFQSESVGCELYFMEWCLTLFSKRLALDVVSRVWDCYILLGEPVVYRTAVGILKVLGPRFEGQSFPEILNTLKTQAASISEEELFKAMNHIKVSDALKQRIAQVNQIMNPARLINS
eukprot:TRINITY_DN9337_c0_g3_i6.p1 TRINITY_DN9337_c0_g3~~TRINITY_DN9337_c0_g3_i6.p1  ORF type:complete len:216 (-),score=56.54 TRINITY_DN9337_c0_g3_i6:27-632(-)